MKICPLCKVNHPNSEFKSPGKTGQESDKSYKWCSACRWEKFGSPKAKKLKKAAIARAKARKAAEGK